MNKMNYPDREEYIYETTTDRCVFKLTDHTVVCLWCGVVYLCFCILSRLYMAQIWDFWTGMWSSVLSTSCLKHFPHLFRSITGSLIWLSRLTIICAVTSTELLASYCRRYAYHFKTNFNSMDSNWSHYRSKIYMYIFIFLKSEVKIINISALVA